MRARRRSRRPLAKNDRIGAVFPNRQGNPYTRDGFSSMWQKLMVEALERGVITTRFTFHVERRGELPDLHASPTTTARVYERSRVSKRDAL